METPASAAYVDRIAADGIWKRLPIVESDSDSDNPKDIDIDPIDGMEKLAFVSVGASSADSILERINKYTNTEEEENAHRNLWLLCIFSLCLLKSG